VGGEVKQKRVIYQPWVLVAVILWSALHDRPRNWACQSKNWSSTTLRPLHLPSASTLSRRADAVGLGLFLRRLEEVLRGTDANGWICIVDGKPLFVGGCSKDPDVRWGYGAGMRGKGYKLHAIWSNQNLPDAWELTPMNCYEATVAQGLLSQLHGGGYLLADGNYDTNALHGAAGKFGYQLLAQNRRPNAGRGHRRHDPFRLRGIDLRNQPFGKALLKYRSTIERDYAQATNFGGGMGPLPAWVRREWRVHTWVWAKLLINATRIIFNKRLTT
jgi:hypothetical protein